MSAPDTIVAVASPTGRGAVGVIRVSGSAVPDIAVALLGGLPPPRSAALRIFRAADGSALDQGLALHFPAPASFTGEDVLELHGHGGVWVLDGLMKRILSLGARAARPGEFSERAFLNGKLDLAQAEAVADLIDAGTAAAARAAVRSLQGEFSTQVRKLQALLTGLRVAVEAGIDFPDEDLDEDAAAGVGRRLGVIVPAFEAITAACRQGTLLRDGVTVVIAGRPNAGKSSLLNRLVGDDVAIVMPVPGTTRDVLRHHIQLGGMPVTLVDTAGLRDAADAVEAEGIRRARVEMQRADHILLVVDATTYEPPDLRDFGDIPVTEVINKVDLLAAAPVPSIADRPARVYVSARTGEGLDSLRSYVMACAGYRETDGGSLSARRRHLDALARARDAFDRAVETLRATGAVELFAEDLRLAQNALAEITGEFSSDDLLGEIFSSFCIGK
jgi:tRNA modification GTPase